MGWWSNYWASWRKNMEIVQWGLPNEKLRCPHCQTTGQVRAKKRDKKTHARCDNCKVDWDL